MYEFQLVTIQPLLSFLLTKWSPFSDFCSFLSTCLFPEWKPSLFLMTTLTHFHEACRRKKLFPVPNACVQGLRADYELDVSLWFASRPPQCYQGVGLSALLRFCPFLEPFAQTSWAWHGCLWSRGYSTLSLLARNGHKGKEERNRVVIIIFGNRKGHIVQKLSAKNIQGHISRGNLKPWMDSEVLNGYHTQYWPINYINEIELDVIMHYHLNSIKCFDVFLVRATSA